MPIAEPNAQVESKNRESITFAMMPRMPRVPRPEQPVECVSVTEAARIIYIPHIDTSQANTPDIVAVLPLLGAFITSSCKS